MDAVTNPQAIALQLIKEYGLTAESFTPHDGRFVIARQALRKIVDTMTPAELAELLGRRHSQMISTQDFFQHELSKSLVTSFRELTRNAAAYIIMELIKQNLGVSRQALLHV